MRPLFAVIRGALIVATTVAVVGCGSGAIASPQPSAVDTATARPTPTPTAIPTATPTAAPTTTPSPTSAITAIATRIVTRLDELERIAATGDGDATGRWANDEGTWLNDHLADLVNQPGALGEYTADLLALLSAVGDGSDQTDAIKDLLALRDEIATSAGIAVATPKPTPKPTPVSYATLSSRAWSLVVKSPDKYTGNHYVVWGCISQFDAATGSDTFRAQASYKKVEYWYSDADNAIFTGDESRLADYVQDDVVQMWVEARGSFTYDTQAGGSTTVPMFQVDKLARKGSCS